MEFFVENWIWFLVAGVIIIMTLIGYIAEKTDFGRKDIPKKEKKQKPLPLQEDEEKENKPEMQMSLATDSILENEQEINNEEDTEEIPEELKVPFGDLTFEEPSTYELEENNNQDLEQVNSIVDEVVESEPTEELKLNDVDTSDIVLPDLETIVSEEDDDVWKF